MREIWRNVVLTSGARIYALAVGMFTLFLTARMLGPEGRGEVAAITTWAGLFGTFAHLSLGQIAVHRMSADPERRRFRTLLTSLMILAAILSTLAWLVAFGLYVVDPAAGIFKGLPPLALAIGLLALPFFIWEQYNSLLLSGLGHIRAYNLSQIIGRTAALAAMFVLVGGIGLGVVGVLLANLIGQVIIAFAGVRVLLSTGAAHLDTLKATALEVRTLLVGGAKLHANAVGTFLIASANILILNHFQGAAATGQFQLAMQLLGVMIIVPQAAGMVIYGRVAEMGADGAWKQNLRLMLHVIGAMAALSAVAAVVAPVVITLLAGEAFAPAGALFQWMLPGLLGLTISQLMAPQWIGRGFFWQAATLSLIIGMLNLSANFLLIPRLGAWGAVYAFVGTYMFSVFVNGLFALWCQRHSIERAASNAS